MKDRPIVQVILDGFAFNPIQEGNAVALSKMPNFNGFLAKHPFTTLNASGIAVGLPWGEVGNSEVGHTNLGSGLVSYQNLPRISIAIEDGSFFENEVLMSAIKELKSRKTALHLVGCLSNGGVHSHISHLFAILQLLQRNKIKNDVSIHAIMDGRDTDPKAGAKFIAMLEGEMKKTKIGKLASMIGRYYAMDRNETWDRTKLAYDLMVEGKGERSTSPQKSFEKAYAENLDDERLGPVVFVEKDAPVGKIQNDDIVIFFNFRPDRARQLTQSLVQPKFDKFERGIVAKNLFFVTMMQYEKDSPVHVVFPPKNIEFPLGKIISETGRRQLRISETEKYAHVTYFFNGGLETPFDKEDRKIIPSPSVATYDEVPEMSSVAVTDYVVKAISSKKYSYILLNYPNPDMVGHTGNLKAGIAAVEACDRGLGRIWEAVEAIDGVLLVCADHGNCDIMIDPVTGRIHKEHTTNPVPVIIVGKDYIREKSPEEVDALKFQEPVGLIADIAPTILELMGVKSDEAMTGRSFLRDIF